MKNVLIIMIAMIGLQGCFVLMKTNSMTKELFPPEFKGKYNTFLESDETEIKTHYHTMLSKKEDGSFVFRQFFPETMTLTKLITYKSDQKTMHGYNASYSDLGELRSEGNYINGLKHGIWFTLGFGEGLYIEGKKEEEWKIKNKEGQLSAIYQYKDDKKEGPFIEYDSLGQIQNEGIYYADTIYSQSKAFDKLKVEQLMPMMSASNCNHLSYPEKVKCSERAMLEHMYKTLRYPRQALEYGVDGQAVVQFTVDVDGSIQDVNVLTGLCQSIKDEVIRVIKSFPAWSPGYTNGKPVKVTYTLPVKFTLGK
jgi:TonB family protein